MYFGHDSNVCTSVQMEILSFAGYIVAVPLKGHSGYIGAPRIADRLRGKGFGRLLLDESRLRLKDRNILVDPDSRSEDSGAKINLFHTLLLMSNSSIDDHATFQEVKAKDVLAEVDAKLMPCIPEWISQSKDDVCLVALQDGCCLGYICLGKFGQIYKLKHLEFTAMDIGAALVLHALETS